MGGGDAVSPFIVATRRAVEDDRTPLGRMVTRMMQHPDAGLAVSRCAVATLEEAHETAREACLYAPGSVETIAQAIREAFALPESGGKVGPLPDGTVIEVERVEWSVLRLAIGMARIGELQKTPEGAAEILAAYNAREEARS